MRRRTFLRMGAAIPATAALSAFGDDTAPTAVMTVRGRVATEKLDVTLPHEHVLVDFIGAELVGPHRYDRNAAAAAILPHLRSARALGLRTLVECTPAYIGRDPLLLKRLSEESDLHILTNTGYYGAAADKYLPAHAFAESADALADRWVREWEGGIDGTDVRPGFIKIGVDPGPLSEVDRKLVQAAARTHLRTGLAIASHTTDGVAASEQLEVLKREAVEAAAFVWVHAHAEPDRDQHERAADAGAWVELDGLGPDSVKTHVELATALRDRGLLGRALVSHDAGWYAVGEAGGGAFRPYDTLFAKFLPALEAAGWTAGDIRRLIVDNPREAFRLRR